MRKLTENTLLILDHDTLGEEYLKMMGFPVEIYCFAKGHVNAIRYMAWKDKGYADSKFSGWCLGLQVTGNYRY